METPEDLFYTLDHEWANCKGKDIIIGITEYAQSQLGDVIFVEVPEIGTILKAGEVFGEIEAVKTVSELYSPISGEVIDVNEDLETNPELVNSDPYGTGWLIKIAPINMKDKEKLLDFKSYKNSIK